MRIKSAYIKLLIGLILLMQAFFQTNPAPNIAQVVPSPTASVLSASAEAHLAKVAKVIDGDTIELEGGVKVRYIGIDTPETKHPQKEKQCFGAEATKKNEELVLGKQVILEKDVSETDKYGRLLRYVYVEEQNATVSSRLFINQELVRQGYAQAITYPPDIKHQEKFLQAQEEARKNSFGLWSLCRLPS